MKYIDADKLITIIEERKAQQDQWINSYHDPINQGISQELAEILSIITSLQQERPEVDLDKLVSEEFASHSRSTEYGLEVTYNRAELYQLIKRMALVFNARKEDEK